MPIWRGGRSTIWSASRFRRCCGASLPGARSAGRVQSVALRLVCDRELEIEKFVRREYWSLVATLATPRRGRVRSAARRRRRQKAAAPRHRLGRRSRSVQASARSRRLHRRQRRGEAGQAPPAAALHHLDAAAGSKPQARLCARRIPCASRSGSTKASTSAARPSASSPICAPTACRSSPRRSRAARSVIGKRLSARTMCRRRRGSYRDQGEERPGSARGDPPDRPRPPPGVATKSSSMRIRPSSTS